MTASPSSPLDDAPGRHGCCRLAACVILAALGVAFCAGAVFGAEPIRTVRFRPYRPGLPPQARVPADYSFWSPIIRQAYGLDAEAAREVDYLLRHKRLMPRYREPVEARKP